MIAYFLRKLKAINKPLSEQEKNASRRIRLAQYDGVASDLPSSEAFNSDLHLVEQLRQGDEDAFTQLFNRYYASMLRFAHIYAAEHSKEIVQEAWSIVLKHLNDFNGQVALKIWLFRFLRESIRTHIQAEGSNVPDYSKLNISATYAHPTVAPRRFFPPGNPKKEGRWAYPPQRWSDSSHEHFSSSNIHAYLQQCIGSLASELQEILALRDIEGWTADEVCSLLEITDENQRVLLHHARSQVRQALEQRFNEEQA